MPEEIVAEVRQVDVLASQGQSIPDTERAIGVTEVTHDHWRQQYGGWKNDQVRMLKDLEAENARLRRALTFMHKATNHDRVITYLKMRLMLALHSYSSNLVTGRQLRSNEVAKVIKPKGTYSFPRFLKAQSASSAQFRYLRFSRMR